MSSPVLYMPSHVAIKQGTTHTQYILDKHSLIYENLSAEDKKFFNLHTETKGDLFKTVSKFKSASEWFDLLLICKKFYVKLNKEKSSNNSMTSEKKDIVCETFCPTTFSNYLEQKNKFTKLVYNPLTETMAIHLGNQLPNTGVTIATYNWDKVTEIIQIVESSLECEYCQKYSITNCKCLVCARALCTNCNKLSTHKSVCFPRVV